MKKNIFLYLFVISAIATGYSQSFQWLKTPATTLNLNPDLVGYSTACDPFGNVYFTGFKNTPVPYTDIFGVLYYNKYDSNGDLVWSKEIGGKAQSYNCVSDSDGNIIMALGYFNEISIDELSLSSANQGVERLLVKFNPEGEILWYKSIVVNNNNPDWNEVSDFRAISIDTNNNIYIGYDTYIDSYITKYSPQGDVISSIIQEEVSRLTSVSVDNEGNIYAAGACANTNATFAGVAVSTDLLYNTYLVKYSASGEYQWVKYVEDISCVEPHVVAKNPNEIYFSSYLFGTYAFDDIITEGVDASFEDFFIAKLNAAGEYQWVKEVPNGSGVALGNRNFLTVDTDGNILFAGRTYNTINWGEGITTNVEGASNNAVLLKYTPEGTLIMAITAGGEDYARADSVAINNNGDIFIAGMARGNVQFGNIENENNELTFYPYLSKINSNTAGAPVTDKVNLLCYPNPSDNYIYFSGIQEPVKGTIINMMGQVVESFTTKVNEPVNIMHLAKGTYIIKPENYTSFKFIKK